MTLHGASLNSCEQFTFLVNWRLPCLCTAHSPISLSRTHLGDPTDKRVDGEGIQRVKICPFIPLMFFIKDIDSHRTVGRHCQLLGLDVCTVTWQSNALTVEQTA